jgi:hypothetical protein
MLQPCCELDLSAKPVDAQVGGDFERQNLDDDLAPEVPVDRQEHAAHAAADDLSLEGVRTAQGTLEGREEVGHGEKLPTGYAARQRECATIHPSRSQFAFAFNSSNQFSTTISLSGMEFNFLIIRKRWSSCDTA